MVSDREDVDGPYPWAVSVVTLVSEKEFRCQIPGDPAPWTVFTRNRAPTPGFYAMKAWQAQIQLHLRRAWGNREPLSGPVVLDCEFYLPWPDSAPQKASASIQRWYETHLVMKPDRDNLQKAFSDACEGILFHGDQQVVRGEAHKDILRPTIYKQCREGYTVIRFRPLEQK